MNTPKFHKSDEFHLDGIEDLILKEKENLNKLEFGEELIISVYHKNQYSKTLLFDELHVFGIVGDNRIEIWGYPSYDNRSMTQEVVSMNHVEFEFKREQIINKDYIGTDENAFL